MEGTGSNNIAAQLAVPVNVVLSLAKNQAQAAALLQTSFLGHQLQELLNLHALQQQCDVSHLQKVCTTLLASRNVALTTAAQPLMNTAAAISRATDAIQHKVQSSLVALSTLASELQRHSETNAAVATELAHQPGCQELAVEKELLARIQLELGSRAVHVARVCGQCSLPPFAQALEALKAEATTKLHTIARRSASFAVPPEPTRGDGRLLQMTTHLNRSGAFPQPTAERPVGIMPQADWDPQPQPIAIESARGGGIAGAGGTSLAGQTLVGLPEQHHHDGMAGDHSHELQTLAKDIELMKARLHALMQGQNKQPLPPQHARQQVLPQLLLQSPHSKTARKRGLQDDDDSAPELLPTNQRTNAAWDGQLQRQSNKHAHGHPVPQNNEQGAPGNDDFTCHETSPHQGIKSNGRALRGDAAPSSSTDGGRGRGRQSAKHNHHVLARSASQGKRDFERKGDKGSTQPPLISNLDAGDRTQDAVVVMEDVSGAGLVNNSSASPLPALGGGEKENHEQLATSDSGGAPVRTSSQHRGSLGQQCSEEEMPLTQPTSNVDSQKQKEREDGSAHAGEVQRDGDPGVLQPASQSKQSQPKTRRQQQSAQHLPPPAGPEQATPGPQPGVAAQHLPPPGGATVNHAFFWSQRDSTSPGNRHDTPNANPTSVCKQTDGGGNEAQGGSGSNSGVEPRPRQSGGLKDEARVSLGLVQHVTTGPTVTSGEANAAAAALKRPLPTSAEGMEPVPFKRTRYAEPCGRFGSHERVPHDVKDTSSPHCNDAGRQAGQVAVGVALCVAAVDVGDHACCGSVPNSASNGHSNRDNNAAADEEGEMLATQPLSSRGTTKDKQQHDDGDGDDDYSDKLLPSFENPDKKDDGFSQQQQQQQHVHDDAKRYETPAVAATHHPRERGHFLSHYPWGSPPTVPETGPGILGNKVFEPQSAFVLPPPSTGGSGHPVAGAAPGATPRFLLPSCPTDGEMVDVDVVQATCASERRGVHQQSQEQPVDKHRVRSRLAATRRGERKEQQVMHRQQHSPCERRHYPAATSSD